MKKNLLLLLGLLLGLTAKAQEPAITATGTVGEERTISVGLNAVGTVKLDWGNGTLVEKTTTQAYDGWDGAAEFTGTPQGDGIIKIYGDGIIYLEANGKFNSDKTDIPNALTAIDVTKATDLTEIAINANKLTTIDLSKNTKLSSLNIANNQFESINLEANAELTKLTANDNLLTAIDLSNNTKLTSVVLSNNKITSLDFSNNKVIKTFTCLNNELTSVTIGANTATGHTFQFGGNKLTSFSLMQATSLANSYVYLRDNEINDLQLPANVRRIWVDGNAFTLSQLYELKSKATQTFTYATTYTKDYAQKPYQIPETIDVNGTVDLFSQATLGAVATVFIWKNAEGTELVEGTDYTVSGGVFTFLTEQEAIHCEMTNTELPNFTTAKPYITTAMKVKDPNAPVITATGTVGEERTISVGLNAVGTVKLDWGNGTLVEKTTTQAYDGWDGAAEFTGTPQGDGIIKIYGDGIIYLEANGKFNSDKTDIPNALTAIDVTKATDLTEIAINANKLTTIDLSKNTKLSSLNIANNQFESINLEANAELTKLTANDNLLTAIDLSNNTKLTSVVLSNNKITSLDFSNNKVIKTFTCLNNELTSVTIGANTATGHTFQFGGNKLTSFSLMQATSLANSYVYLRDNEINDLQLPANVRRIWVDGNAFTLSQLYELKSKATQTFTYATTYTKDYAQKPYQIPETIDVNGTVDLFSQATLGAVATVFIWKNAEGTELVEGTDYTVSGGVFTFLTEQEAIHCEMTNTELPNFTTAKPYITTTMKVGDTTGINSIINGEVKGEDVWYNLNGQRIAQPTKKGLYIHNGKKVIFK